jgi:hypothetical protein
MTPAMEEQVRTSIAIEKKMMACLGREWTGDLHHSVWNLTDDMVAEIERLRAGLDAAIRCAELALFVIRKQGVMPNSSWESGFNGDLRMAKMARNADAELIAADRAHPMKKIKITKAELEMVQEAAERVSRRTGRAVRDKPRPARGRP